MAPLTKVSASRLQTTLLSSGLQSTNNDLYQVISQIISALVSIDNAAGEIITNNSSGKTIINGIGIPGEDGIDGADGLSIIGPAGANGVNGSIGLTGPAIIDTEVIENFITTIPGPQGNTGPQGAAGSNGAITLIGQSNGTDATAAATNVATFNISGLTVKDSLLVIVTLSELVANCANPILYHNDDALTIQSLIGGATLTPSRFAMDTVIITNDQSSDKQIVSLDTETALLTATGTNNGGVNSKGTTLTTSWTSNWVLALRTGAGGVSAGGTLRFRIAVYKIAGQ